MIAYYCSSDNLTGSCEVSDAFCESVPFTSTIACEIDGVDAASETESLTVDGGYPNPAISSIRFDYMVPNQGMMTATLVDMLGKTVSTSSRPVSNGDGNVTIDLAGAQPGNYYCVFELNGERVTKRIEIK